MRNVVVRASHHHRRPAAPPVDTHDAYLRLHLLSHRLVRPNTINLDGIFGLLENGGVDEPVPSPSTSSAASRRSRGPGRRCVFGRSTSSRRWSTTWRPSGVRIADADRVRLGAHLAEGTTVMHEGYVNFNAGTLGTAMVEGRITQGVVIGEGSDLGGGASIMGTLSGGGKNVVRIGERCLIGANGGDRHLPRRRLRGRGRPVRHRRHPVTLPDGQVVKAAELSGQPGCCSCATAPPGRSRCGPGRAARSS